MIFRYFFPPDQSRALSTIRPTATVRSALDLSCFGFFGSRLPRCCLLAMTMLFQVARFNQAPGKAPQIAPTAAPIEAPGIPKMTTANTAPNAAPTPPSATTVVELSPSSDVLAML